ncbi:unnamed protein product [Moneuplotes crassus]|uniref:LITAF domain-containing protein n=1 Tax=Euplotes crassus TaxID=5936 RepID=A0AAD1XDZ1_EUPCR|nr:unnamed protein product [Moneuplotes crassus]
MDPARNGYGAIVQDDPEERKLAQEDSTRKEIVTQETPIRAYCRHCLKTHMTRVETECNCSAVPLCIYMVLFCPFCYLCIPCQCKQTRESYHICTHCNQKLFRVVKSISSMFQFIGQTIENVGEDFKEIEEQRRNEEDQPGNAPGGAASAASGGAPGGGAAGAQPQPSSHPQEERVVEIPD